MRGTLSPPSPGKGYLRWGLQFSTSLGVSGPFLGEDKLGHGTHCAGIIGGQRWGVAKKATVHSIKVLNAETPVTL